jgi:hypothetical protein
MATRVKAGAEKAGKAAKHSVAKGEAAIKGNASDKAGPSRNPITNLIIADIALRSGGRLLRHVVERTLLGVTYPPDKARKIVKGRGMARTLIGSAVARIATRSVPGALVVGGGLLAKTLYDRKRKGGETEAEGAKEADEQAEDAS